MNVNGSSGVGGKDFVKLHQIWSQILQNLLTQFTKFGHKFHFSGSFVNVQRLNSTSPVSVNSQNQSSSTKSFLIGGNQVLKRVLKVILCTEGPPLKY